MLKPVTRMIAGFMSDASLGLVAVAKRALEAPSTFELPLFNSADHAGLMGEQIMPDTTPSWCLWVEAATKATAQGNRNVLLVGGYATSADADPMESSEMAEMTMRAAHLCLDQYNRVSVAESYRVLDNVRILKIVDVAEDAIPSTKGQTRVWGFIGIHLLAVDLLA